MLKMEEVSRKEFEEAYRKNRKPKEGIYFEVYKYIDKSEYGKAIKVYADLPKSLINCVLTKVRKNKDLRYALRATLSDDKKAAIFYKVSRME